MMSTARVEPSLNPAVFVAFDGHEQNFAEGRDLLGLLQLLQEGVDLLRGPKALQFFAAGRCAPATWTYG